MSDKISNGCSLKAGYPDSAALNDDLATAGALIFGVGALAAGAYCFVSGNWITGILITLFGSFCIAAFMGSIFKNNAKVYRLVAFSGIAAMVLFAIGFILLLAWIAATGIMDILAGKWAIGGMILLMFVYSGFLALAKKYKINEILEYLIVTIFIVAMFVLFIFAAGELHINVQDVSFSME